MTEFPTMEPTIFPLIVTSPAPRPRVTALTAGLRARLVSRAVFGGWKLSCSGSP